MISPLFCHYAASATTPGSLFGASAYPVFDLLRCDHQEAAGEAGQHQYGDVRAIADGAGNWAGDGGKDHSDAPILWRVQER